MNPVDLADQLANTYRCDHSWWRNRKPWWSLFMWLLRRAMVHGYRIHCYACRDAGRKPMKHLIYHKKIACWLLGARREKKSRKKEPEPDQTPVPHTRARLAEEIRNTTQTERASVSMLNKTYLERSPRLDGTFHPTESVASSRTDTTHCQWCKFKHDKLKLPLWHGRGRQQRAHIRCITCRIRFCSPECYSEYHTTPIDLTKL